MGRVLFGGQPRNQTKEEDGHIKKQRLVATPAIGRLNRGQEDPNRGRKIDLVVEWSMILTLDRPVQANPLDGP